MKKVELGKTGIQVTKIGLGCWQFSGSGGAGGGYWKTMPAEEMNRIVKAVLDAGVNWFDTAQAYGQGNSERNLARALHAAGINPGKVVIADKWWPLAKRAASITKTIDKRLEFLSGYPIDLYQIHWPNSVSSIQAQMNAMADLVEAGKIRSVGVSNFSEAQMREAHEALQKRGLVLASNQVRYNLLDRRIETNGILETAREQGITVIAYSPLAQGMLTGRFHKDPSSVKKVSFPRRFTGAYGARALGRTRPVIEALLEIGRNHNATASQVALNWLVNFHKDTVVAIPGASTVSQSLENAGAHLFSLSSEELLRLDELTRGFK